MKKEGKVLPDRVPPEPNNPMGPVKFSFVWSRPGAEPLSKVHGINHPDSIGTRESSGCIRMYTADALALAAIVEPLFKTGNEINVLYIRDLTTGGVSVASD